MNKYLRLGVLFASGALIFYSIFFWRTRKLRLITIRNCIIQIAGFGFDVAGTIFMIIGSKNIPITLHGVIGYTALAAMAIKTLLVWKNAFKKYEVTCKMKMYSIISYIWWIAAYIAGGILAMIEMGGCPLPL